MRRQRIQRATILALTAGALALGLAACGGSSGSSSDSGQAPPSEALCNELKNFSSAVAQLEGLDPDTASADDIKSAASNVESAANDVSKAAKNAEKTVADQLQKSVQVLKTTAEQLPSSDTPQQKLQALGPAISSIQQQWNSYFRGSGCASS